MRTRKVIIKDIFAMSIFALYISVLNCCRRDELNKNDVGENNISEPFDNIIFATNKTTHKPYLLTSIKDDDKNFLLSDDILIPKTEVNNVKILNELSNYDKNEAQYDTYFKNYRVTSPINGSGPIEPGTRLWDNATINLSIGQGFTRDQVNTITNAITQWRFNTKLKFNIVDETDKRPKIRIASVKKGCSCTVGQPENGEGVMKLSPTCDLQSVMHEIGHAVGLIHEHQRPKRDSYLKDFYTQKDNEFIIKGLNELGQDGERIVKNMNYNLEVTSVLDDSSPFDYRSVMMYGSYPRNNLILRDFLMKNNMPNYRDLNGGLIERPTFGLTPDDQQKIAKIYHYSW